MSAQPKRQKKRGRPVPLTIGLAAARSYAGAFLIGKLLKEQLKGPVERIDREVTHITREASGKRLDRVMGLMSGLGEPFTLYPVAGLAALLWLVRGHKESSAGVVVSLLGAAAMNKAVKSSVQRPRPKFALHRQNSSGSSFPSNHITMAFAVYGAVAYLITRRLRKGKRGKSRKIRMLVWAPVLLLCSLIAWSRIYEGVHHVTDVLVGWMVAGIWVGAGGRVATRLDSGK
jgi:membrane-associated phospholipid phosphatase